MKKIYIALFVAAILIVTFLNWFIFKDSTTSQAINDIIDKSAEVICYSGGKEIYSGRSTGKVYSEKQSDGWFFKDKASGRLMEVSGDCIFRY
jgi:hypothetical protein